MYIMYSIEKSKSITIASSSGNLPKTNSFESKIDSNMFDPTKNSPPNEWLQKLQSRIDEYYNKELNINPEEKYLEF